VRASRTGIALLLATGLAGCGSSGDNNQPGLTNGQAQALVSRLESVRSSASARNVAGTKTALAKFRGTVVSLRRSGAISDATARSLRIGAARVLARVKSDNAPPPQPVTTSTPAPAPVAPGPKKKHDQKKPGKGKGHGKGEGGD
jgi:hypothetical protein